MRKGQNEQHTKYRATFSPAGDFSVYTQSKAEARTVENSMYQFLRNKLKLSINSEKSGLRKPVQFEILGFSFVPAYIKGEKGKYQTVVSSRVESSSLLV